MALFRGIQEYIALDANNITLVFDSGNIVNISGNIFLYPPQGHPILYKYKLHRGTVLRREKRLSVWTDGDSHIRIPQSPSLILNSSFTFLIYASPNGEIGSIIEYYVRDSMLGLQMWFFHTWNTLCVYMNANRNIYSTRDVREYRWYFLGFSYDMRTNNLSAWKDGDKVGTQASSTHINMTAITSGDIYLGFRKKESWYWRGGGVACLMMYGAALSRDLVATWPVLSWP